MEIETERLILMAFSRDLIQAALGKDDGYFLKSGIRRTENWPEPDLMEALPHFYQQITDHGETGFNNWLMLDKDNKDIVGSLGFIAAPDGDGSIEIGFGVVPGKRRQGYCAEAAAALIRWAGQQPQVKCITAQCDVDNERSINLLKKLGFEESPPEAGLQPDLAECPVLTRWRRHMLVCG